MGGSSSKSEVDNTVNSIVKVLNSTTENCYNGTYQGQTLTIQNIINQCGTQNIGGINQTQSGVLDTKCMQSASTQTAIQTNLQNTIAQQTQAISQFASFAPSDAQSITQIVTNLASDITNAYTGNCAAAAAQNQQIAIGNIANLQSPSGACGTQNIGGISQQQTINSILNCVQSDPNVVSDIATLTNAINQNTTAKSQGPLGFLSDLADAFGGIFKGVTGLIVGAIIIIVIIAVIILVIYLLFHFLHHKSTPATTTTALIPPTALGAVGTAGLPTMTGAYGTTPTALTTPSAPPLETGQISPPTAPPTQANGRYYHYDY
jgi:hypothetical protein